MSRKPKRAIQDDPLENEARFVDDSDDDDNDKKGYESYEEEDFHDWEMDFDEQGHKVKKKKEPERSEMYFIVEGKCKL